MKAFLAAFIPLFVAVDALGVLPIFISLTEGIKKPERAKVIFQSMITALCLALGFIVLGKAVFKFLGITIGDFLVAGGAILFCIAIIGIVNPDKKRGQVSKELAAVPLGTPLVVGPAVLTTCLILLDQYGMLITMLAVSANVALAGVVFYLADYLIKIIGESGAKALSKVTSLLLGAIGIMMLRKGIVYLLREIRI